MKLTAKEGYSFNTDTKVSVNKGTIKENSTTYDAEEKVLTTIVQFTTAAQTITNVDVTGGTDITIPDLKTGSETTGTFALTLKDEETTVENYKAVKWDVSFDKAAVEGTHYNVSYDETTGIPTVTVLTKMAELVAPEGTVTMTVTAKASESVKDSVELTLTRGASDATSLEIKGDDSIVIPAAEGSAAATASYSAIVLDQYGKPMEVSATLSSTNSLFNDGTITVPYGTKPCTVTLTAEYTGLEKKVTKDVSIVALKAEWPEITTNPGIYGYENQELVNLPESTELPYTLGTGIGKLIGEYTVLNPETKQDAGEKIVTVQFKASGSDANGNYKELALTKDIIVTIDKKDIKDVEGISLSKECEYNGEEHKPEPTVTVAGLTYDLEYSNNINAGTEAIVKVTAKTDCTNYKGEKVLTFTIVPKTVEVKSVSGIDKTYDGTAAINKSEVSVTVDGFVSGEEATVTVDSASYDSTYDVGVQPATVKVSLTGENAGNYCFEDGTKYCEYKTTGNITKADAPEVEDYELTVYYRDNTNKTVDAADFGITEGEDGWKDVVLASDFSGGTVISAVTANADGTLTLTPTASADAKATNEITVTINSKNYTETTAKITVEAVDISIPWPAEPTIKEAPVYGDTNAKIISGFESKVIATTDKDIPGTITVKDADATPAAGTTAVTLVFTPDNGYGFDGQTFEHSYDISAVKPATITVTPDDGQSKVYGEDDPDEFTYTVSGAKNGEEVKISGKLEREDGETVGTYGYSVADMTLEENGAFEPSNYTLEVASGVMFTIEPKPVGVSIEVNTEYVYDGTAKKPGKDFITVIYTDGESEAAIDATDYEIVGYGENTNAGKGTVKISASENGNYSFDTNVCEFDIKPKPVTVSWEHQPADGEETTFVYDGTVPALKGTYEDVNEETCSDVSVAENAATDVGTNYADVVIKDTNYVAEDQVSYIIIAATAENAEIKYSMSGREKVGQELTAVVTINGNDVTDDFDIEWYLVGEDDEEDTLIGEGKTLELTNDYKGKTVYYKAVGDSENVDISAPVKSEESDKITKRSSSDSIRRDEEEEIVVRVEDLNAAQRENFTNLLFTYGPYADIKLGFSDVAASAWYYDYVTDMANAGVINGYPDGTFRPEGDVTWGETLKLVMKAVGYPDIPAVDSHWASGYMATAIADLLISGEVDLDAAITREEVANLTAQALKLAPAGIEYPFEDNAPEAAVALYAAGIITGSLDNGQLLFRAESTITRAEMAAIIYRVYNAK